MEIAKEFESKFDVVKIINTTLVPFEFGYKSNDLAKVSSKMREALDSVLEKSNRDIMLWRIKPEISSSIDTETAKTMHQGYFRLFVSIV